MHKRLLKHIKRVFAKRLLHALKTTDPLGPDHKHGGGMKHKSGAAKKGKKKQGEKKKKKQPKKTKKAGKKIQNLQTHQFGQQRCPIRSGRYHHHSHCFLLPQDLEQVAACQSHCGRHSECRGQYGGRADGFYSANLRGVDYEFTYRATPPLC